MINLSVYDESFTVNDKIVIAIYPTCAVSRFKLTLPTYFVMDNEMATLIQFEDLNAAHEAIRRHINAKYIRLDAGVPEPDNIGNLGDLIGQK